MKPLIVSLIFLVIAATAPATIYESYLMGSRSLEHFNNPRKFHLIDGSGYNKIFMLNDTRIENLSHRSQQNLTNYLNDTLDIYRYPPEIRYNLTLVMAIDGIKVRDDEEKGERGELNISYGHLYISGQA